MSTQPTCRPPARGRLVCVLLIALCLAACDPVPSQSGPAVSVFSGKTAQQRILAEITMQTLRHQGYAVEDYSGWGSETQVRRAMAAGNADICWAYTNDIWSLHLRHDQPLWDSAELYAKVRDEDALNGITWLPPSPCHDGLALITTQALATKYELATIDDLIHTLETVDPSLRLGVSADLANASGGLAGLERVYGYSFQERYRLTVATERGHEALLAGECDLILNYRGLAALHPEMVVLDDTRRFFPFSELTLGVRSPLLKSHGYLQGHLLAITRALTNEELAAMERQVTIEEASPQSVARAFLKSHALLD